MIYFTSDTHFNHGAIIRLCERPFADVDEMNHVMMTNWNSTVSDQDELYFLGDFMFKGGAPVANELLSKLNGKKYLIKGNHDKFMEDRTFKKDNFVWIKDYHVLDYEKRKIVLFHFPILEWDGYWRRSIHLYGHVHNAENKPEQRERFSVLGNRAINVSVDLNDFRPLSIEEILERADREENPSFRSISG